jgi:hypothetical protein
MVCTGHNGINPIAGHAHDHDEALILFEVGSPASMAGGRVSSNAVAFNLMKWVIFNTAKATELAIWVNRWPHIKMKVSASSAWTLGHDVKRRHLISKADAKNKDLRECQSMIYFYERHPTAWCSLDTYLEAL